MPWKNPNKILVQPHLHFKPVSFLILSLRIWINNFRSHILEIVYFNLTECIGDRYRQSKCKRWWSTFKPVILLPFGRDNESTCRQAFEFQQPFQSASSKEQIYNRIMGSSLRRFVEYQKVSLALSPPSSTVWFGMVWHTIICISIVRSCELYQNNRSIPSYFLAPFRWGTNTLIWYQKGGATHITAPCPANI